MKNTWFMYDVSINWDSEVLKTPRAPWNTSIENERLSVVLHNSYLWDYVPDTKIISSDTHWFLTHQELVNWWNHIDLAIESTKQDVIDLLEKWVRMQKEQKILFDIFWMQWMINLFNYYFKWTNIKKFSDLLLPANAKYLQLMHNLPPEALIQMNSDIKSKPFVAYNILRDDKWILRFIDTDYRPLDIFHPLNLVGNWITEKALRDIKRIGK